MAGSLIQGLEASRVVDPHPSAASAQSETCLSNENTFLEFRHKVQESELLSAATERLLARIRFNGRLSVVVRGGRVCKSAYEEGYFRRKNEFAGS